jgi:hypothetical protein
LLFLLFIEFLMIFAAHMSDHGDENSLTGLLFLLFIDFLMVFATYTPDCQDEYPFFSSNQRSGGRTCKDAWHQHPDSSSGDLLPTQQLCGFFQVPEKPSLSINETVVCTVDKDSPDPVNFSNITRRKGMWLY